MKQLALYAQRKTGFTLIELLVVATIIIVLSAIGMVSFVNAGKSARNAKRKSDLETVRQALVLYKSDIGTYPDTDSFTTLVGAGYLGNGYISAPVPVDPKDGVTDCGSGGTVLCGYQYLGDPTEFTLTAPLEESSSEDDLNFTLTNP